MTADDDELVRTALAAAVQADAGNPPSESVQSLLRAAALTRGEQQRHALEREARARTDSLGEVGLQVLRVLLAVV